MHTAVTAFRYGLFVKHRLIWELTLMPGLHLTVIPKDMREQGDRATYAGKDQVRAHLGLNTTESLTAKQVLLLRFGKVPGPLFAFAVGRHGLSLTPGSAITTIAEGIAVLRGKKIGSESFSTQPQSESVALFLSHKQY